MNVQRDVLVATATAVQFRHALAAQAEARTRLRSGTHGQRFLAVQRRNRDLGAQCGLGIGDRVIAENVQFVTPEDLVFAYVQYDVQVTGHTAGRPGLSLAADAHAYAVIHAGRDLDGDGLLDPHASFAGTGLARVGDELAGALAVSAGTGNREESLLERDLALPRALRAGIHTAGFGARSVALLAGV